MKTILATITLLLCSNLFYGQSDNYETTQKNTMDGTLYGIKNRLTNQEIIPAIYDNIATYKFGKFVVTKNKLQGVVDTLNKIIIPLKYSFVTDYMKDRVFLKTNEKLAMADENGKILTEFIYDDVLGYQDGVARLVINHKIGYIDNQGKIILPFKFDAGDNCKGNFIVIHSTRWDSYGYDLVTKNEKGKTVNRQNIGTTSEFPIIFNTSGKLIYKGESGEQIIIPPSKKIAIADKYLSNSYDRKYTIIKGNGEKLEPIYFRSLDLTNEWIKITTSDDMGWKYGILNFEGEIVLKPKFKTISNYTFNNDQSAKVEFQNGEFFYIDKNGKCIIFDNKNCPE
jgi:WG containing repeat